MARIKYRSEEVLKKRSLFIKRFTLIFCILIILITSGLILLLRMESIQIREVNIEGTNIIDKKEVQDLVDSSLTGNYFWVIPKSNIFLYKIKKLNNDLIEKFPGIYKLDVGRNGFNKIYIKIIERKPEALWCEDLKNESSPLCYFVDSAGIIFARAPFFSGNVYFMYSGVLNAESPLGVQIFTAQDFSAFQSFIKQSTSKLGIPIVGVELKDRGDFDLLLSYGSRILLNKNISYDEIYNNMNAVFKSNEFSSSTLSTLDYIDMRFGNKIYYKNKISQK